MIVEQLFGKKKLTESEKQIVEFINNNPRIVINFSLEELSKKCYVSQASIIRLCKKLGLKGFAEFKIKFASELNAYFYKGKEISVDLPISPDLTKKEIVETFFNLTSHALQNAFQNLDYKSLYQAALMISKADLIHIYGRGESLILAEDFHYKLIRIGKHCSLDTLDGFQEARCLLTDNKLNQVALVISHYCNSQQFHYTIDELINSKTPFVLITAVDKAWPYENFAKVTLRINNSESRFKMGSFSSRTGILFILDCLYGQIFSLDYEKNKNYLTLFSQRKIERNYFYNSNNLNAID